MAKPGDIDGMKVFGGCGWFEYESEGQRDKAAMIARRSAEWQADQDRGRSKVLAGLEDACTYVLVRHAIIDWVFDDAPLAVKMNVQPEHLAKLADRIMGSKTLVGVGDKGKMEGSGEGLPGKAR